MKIMHKLLGVLAFTSLLSGVSLADEITLQVQFPNSRTTAPAHQEIKERFEKENPGIRIKFLAPANGYEEASQKIIRSSMINDLPDVTYQGLNMLRPLVDRKIAVPLDAFIKADGGADVLGYDAGMLRAGTMKNAVYGIPFAVSTPILYVNEDLLKKAGYSIKQLESGWDAVIEAGRKIEKAEPGVDGFYFQWDITGNWLFQALVFSHGGTMMSEDETKVQFDSEAGLAAVSLLQKFADAGMPNLPSSQARPAFTAGKIGIFVDSSSNMGKATKQIAGKFKFKALPFPLVSDKAHLPAGGNLIMMVSPDPARQKAAWKYIKFATGPIGQTIMATHTGYLPSNKIAVETEDMLGKFYASHPNYQTSIKQVPLLTGWYAFPGSSGIKIIDTIKGDLEEIILRKKSGQEALKSASQKVQKLIDTSKN